MFLSFSLCFGYLFVQGFTIAAHQEFKKPLQIYIHTNTYIIMDGMLLISIYCSVQPHVKFLLFFYVISSFCRGECNLFIF